jgi:hypothetical protein
MDSIDLPRAAVEAMCQQKWQYAAQLLRQSIDEMKSHFLAESNGGNGNTHVPVWQASNGCYGSTSSMPQSLQVIPIHSSAITMKLTEYQNNTIGGTKFTLYQYAFVHGTIETNRYHKNKQRKCLLPCETPIALFYNLGLTYHMTGLLIGNDDFVSKALQLYTVASRLLLPAIKQIDHCSPIPEKLKLMCLAIYNNMGAIYEQFGCETGARACISRVHHLLLTNTNKWSMSHVRFQSLSSPMISSLSDVSMFPHTETLDDHYKFFSVSLLYNVAGHAHVAPAA